MGDTRYRADEAEFGVENGADVCAGGVTGSDGSDAVSGFKLLAALLLAVAVLFVFRSFVLERVVVSGDSMNPTFSDGDVMWAKKFGINELARYQVVVAETASGYVIKRVIGLPNETVEIAGGFVYIDGEKLADDVAEKALFYGVAEDGVELGNDEYFLMGDNRNNSTDSRVWGAVNIENIKGIVTFRFFPFWKIGFVE